MSVKSSLLKALEQNKGEYISGQKLASMLDVSRNSVSKAANSLKDEGYTIKSVRNKGYMLAPESRILSAEALSEHLATQLDPDNIIILDSVDSTNNEAKRMVMNEPGYGKIIFAENQSSGKGRLGRNFSSPPGDSLYVSFVLEPLVDVNDSLLITVGASVAVARAVKMIESVNDEKLIPQIKWVNDVYLDNKKICGILTEAVSDIESGQIQSLILGIGININTDPGDYPDEFREQIGVLRIPPGQRNMFAAMLIDEVFRMQDEIRDYSVKGLGEPGFMKEYRESSLLIGKNIFVIRNDEKIKARAIDVDSRGGLIVEYETGERDTLSTGEVSIRLNS